MFHVLNNTFGKIALGLGATIVTATILKRTGGDKALGDAARKVGGKACDVTQKCVDVLAATGELVITGADKTVETVAYGVGAVTREALDLGSTVGSAKTNPVSRGFSAGFYRPEAQAMAKAAEATPAVQQLVDAIVDNGGIANA